MAAYNNQPHDAATLPEPPEQDSEEASSMSISLSSWEDPSPQWWESTRHALAELQELTRLKPTAGHDPDQDQNEKPDEPIDEYAASARQAQAASLPAITLLPAGDYARSVSCVGDAIQCLVFGTVGRKLFVELLCEMIALEQEAQNGKIAVYEILRGEIPKITLSTENHTFELRYLQCEELARWCV